MIPGERQEKTAQDTIEPDIKLAGITALKAEQQDKPIQWWKNGGQCLHYSEVIFCTNIE